MSSGLYLTLNRIYDSNTGRWLSRDPIEEAGGINPYRYCGNNPICCIDPSGLINVYFYGAGPTGPGYSNDELTQMAKVTGGTFYDRNQLFGQAKAIKDIKAARAANPEVSRKYYWI